MKTKNCMATKPAGYMVLILTLILSACGSDGFEYSDYHCNLTLDNSTHLDATLASSMNAMSPGVFCTIGFKIDNGVKYYTFANNQNASTQSIFNAIDERLQNQNRMGIYNGIIVGYGNLDNPPIFFAYDLQCPNCFRSDAIPLRSHPVSVNSNGIAVCSNCQREYNLNTGGNIVKGSNGTAFYRYRASTTGANGTLHVY